MYASSHTGFTMNSSAEERLFAATWSAPDSTSSAKNGPRPMSGTAPASKGSDLRFLGDVSQSNHIVAAAKPVVQQPMMMLARAAQLRSSLMMKARLWMITHGMASMDISMALEDVSSTSGSKVARPSSISLPAATRAASMPGLMKKSTYSASRAILLQLLFLFTNQTSANCQKRLRATHAMFTSATPLVSSLPRNTTIM